MQPSSMITLILWILRELHRKKLMKGVMPIEIGKMDIKKDRHKTGR